MSDFRQSIDQGKRTLQFCPYCGTRLDPGARFCKNCGESVVEDSCKTNCESQDSGEYSYRDVYDEPKNERKTVYEGNLHKCPNCGEVLDSFVANCPSCGYEIRDASSVGSVKELAARLQQIEAQKMPEIVVKKSLMKTLFGKDFNNKDEVDEARSAFRSQKEREKINLITNFPVPNTREDIIEFMLLASSNINVKELYDEWSKAWLSKLEQVYQKAKISITDKDDLKQVETIYENKMREIRSIKTKMVFFWVGIVAAVFFFAGLAWNPVATIVIAVFVIVLLIVCFNMVKRKHTQNHSS